MFRKVWVLGFGIFLAINLVSCSSKNTGHTLSQSEVNKVSGEAAEGGTSGEAARKTVDFEEQKATDSKGPEPGFYPVRVGKGPLLFFDHPESDLGIRIYGRKSDLREVIYVYDPTTQKPPQLLWRGDRVVRRPWPCYRLDLNNVLFRYKGQLCIVDLSQGNVRPILPTENNTSFLGVDDNKIYFWENIKPDQQASDNLTGTSGKAFSEYPRYRFRIYFLVKSQPGNPQRLTNFDFELPRFFREADKDYWWVVTYGENRKLGRLYRDGRIEEIISLEPNWYFLYSSRKVSPNQKYAALGLYNFEHGPFFRDLVVIDLNQKELIFKKERISVKDPMSSIITNPWYNYYWLDDTSLLYQEQLYFRVWFDVDSLLAGKDDPQEEKRAGQNLPWWHDPNNEPNWIEVEVETGQTRKVDIKEMIKSGKFIPPRIRPDRETRGYFELDYGEVYYKGEETPVGSVLNNRGSKVQDLEVCPKGEWAAFVSPVGSNFNLYIVDGKKKKKTLLMRGWCGDLKWLPSVK